MQWSPQASLLPDSGDLPGRLWVPAAAMAALASLLLLVAPDVAPEGAITAGSITALLGLAALQRCRRRTAAARLSLLALCVGVVVIGVGAATAG